MTAQKGGAAKPEGAPITFSLPRRLLATFLVFVLTLYIAGMAVAAKLGQNAFRDVCQMYESRISSLAEQLDAELERIQTQINYVTTRPIVQYLELATPAMAFSEIYPNVRQVGELMYALRNSSGLIEDTSVFLPQLEKVIFSDGSYRAPSEKDAAFVRKYRSAGGKELFVSAEGQLYLVSDSMRISNTEQSALVRVQLSQRVLSEWCGRFAENSRICLLAADETNEPYFLSVGDARQPETVFCADTRQMAHGEDEQPLSDTVRIEETEYLRMSSPVGGRDLWVSGYVDMRLLRNVTMTFSIWQIVLTAFLVLEITVFLYIIRKMISKPTNRFVSEVQTLKEKGMLQLTQQPGDNMDFLYYAFMGVSENLKASLEQAYNNKLLAYQSEIKFLQAQVNPHFLYNSFYHLYRMAKMEDNEGVAEMTQRLSSYYRYITRSDQNTVPLAMEYENIEDYTDIQTIRFGERIRVELAPLPPEYAQREVPRFVLQPLFENAYYHGVEKILDGRIRLRFEPTESSLAIYVENNGKCADEELRALTEYLENDEPGQKMTALKNVKSRMRLLGGDLTVSRGSLGGFCVALTLPDEKAKEE